MMSGEAWLFLLAVLINAVNLFLQVFFTIMYSDLEWYVTTSRPASLLVPLALRVRERIAEASLTCSCSSMFQGSWLTLVSQ